MRTTQWLARMRGLIVLAALPALTSCAGDSPLACHDMAVFNTASMEFSPAISDPGMWSIELHADELHCVRFAALGQPSPSDPDAGANARGIVPSMLANVPECHDGWPSGSAYSVEVFDTSHWPPSTTVKSVRISTMASNLIEELTYRAYLGTELRSERTVQFSYESSEPNGPGCGHVSSATVKTPP